MTFSPSAELTCLPVHRQHHRPDSQCLLKQGGSSMSSPFNRLFRFAWPPPGPVPAHPLYYIRLDKVANVKQKRNFFLKRLSPPTAPGVSSRSPCPAEYRR